MLNLNEKRYRHCILSVYIQSKSEISKTVTEKVKSFYGL